MNTHKPSWRDLSRGAVSYRSSEEYETGDWGVDRPEIDRSKCTRCTLCHYYCPEGAIEILEDGSPEVDIKFCKGCSICSEECPVHCIEMVRKT
jgi:pyruvate ferredoxin oxidoreductase delta subunit